MKTYYLTTKAIGGPYLTVLPTFELDNATLSTDLSAAGWRIAEYENTGLGVLVRPKHNRRWLAAWGMWVTDFEVRSMETVANSDGVIIGAMGAPKKLKLYTQHECLKSW